MKKNKGVVMTEVLISSSIIVLVFISVIGVFVTSKWLYAFGLAQSNLQKDVALVAESIIIRNPSKEQAGIYGLRSAAFFSLPDVVPPGSEIDFTGTDGNVRRYFKSGNSIIYDSPTRTPHQQTIYTAPTGGSITLLFWVPIDNESVGIYILITQNLWGKTASGSISTHVNIRNKQK